MRGLANVLGIAAILLLTPAHARAQSATPSGVSTAAQGHGWRLVDGKGMTLYVYEGDEKGAGKSTCNAACAKLWPPVLVTGDGPVPQDWSIIRRDNGERQWAFRGKPLYRYSREAYPGGTFGDGSSWKVAFEPVVTPPGIVVAKTLLGEVLATATGLTLYTRGTLADKKKQDASACKAACLEMWLPVAAPWMATTTGDFTAVEREDGVRQWAYKDALLYQYFKDARPADTKGHGIDATWNAAVLEPASPFPDWVKVVGSDGGELLADERGWTLYAYDEERNVSAYGAGQDCPPECVKESWQAVPAKAEVPPLGNWSVRKNEDGSLQWAYQGKPLFTSKYEKQPGDLTGIILRRSRAYRPIMYTQPSIQGAGVDG